MPIESEIQHKGALDKPRLLHELRRPPQPGIRQRIGGLFSQDGVPVQEVEHVNAGGGAADPAESDDLADANVQLLQPIAENPRVVIVLLGGNDYLRRVPTDETFANLERIVTSIRRQGAAVILVGVGVGVMTDPYRARYEALARQTSAGLIPGILDGIMGHPDLMSDSIHPNGRGYAIVAERIEPLLRELAFP